MRPEPLPDVTATREVMAFGSRARQRHGPSLGRRLESAYVAVLALLVVSSMVLSGSAGLLSGTGCSEVAGCLDPRGRPALAIAVALAGWGVLWGTTVSLGPVGSSPAEASWLLNTPLDRRTLLTVRAGRALASAFGYGALLGWVVLASWQPTGPDAAGVAPAVLIGAAAAICTVALAILRQAGRHGPASAAPGRLALALAGACTVAALVPLRLPEPVPSIESTVPAVVALVLALLSIAVTVSAVAVRQLAQVSMRELISAGSAQEGVYGSVLMMDLSYAAPRLRGRVGATGRARSHRGYGSGRLALLLRDLQLTLRRPGLLLGAVGLVLIPALAITLNGLLLAQVVALLLGLQVARSAARSLHTVAGSAGLGRALPFPGRQTTALLLFVPVLVTLAWSGAVSAALGSPPWSAVALAAAAAAGMLRSASRLDSDGPGALLMTEAGPLPVGMIRSFLRGPDVMLLAAAPLLLGAGPLFSVALPVIALIVLTWSVGGHRT